MQNVCTLSENCESGIYAPITNPDAAESIPKNALLAADDLKNKAKKIKLKGKATTLKRCPNGYSNITKKVVFDLSIGNNASKIWLENHEFHPQKQELFSVEYLFLFSA